MKKIIATIITSAALTVSAAAQDASMMGSASFSAGDRNRPMTLATSSYTYQPAPQPRVFKEQDLVTIIVNMSSKYSNKADLQKQKKINAKMGLTDWIRFVGIGKMPEPVNEDQPVVGAVLDHQTRAKGDLSRSESLNFKIKCRISRKLDNGNLQIEGIIHMHIGEEIKQVYLSGIISPDDIGANNTISSDDIYDLDIRDTPAGNVFDSVKRNYGTRFIERWSPF